MNSLFLLLGILGTSGAALLGGRSPKGSGGENGKKTHPNKKNDDVVDTTRTGDDSTADTGSDDGATDQDSTGGTGSGDGATDQDNTGGTGSDDGATDQDNTGGTGSGDGSTDQDNTGGTGSGDGSTDQDSTGGTGSGDGSTDQDNTGGTGASDGSTDQDSTGGTGSGDGSTDQDSTGGTGASDGSTDQDSTGGTGSGGGMGDMGGMGSGSHTDVHMTPDIPPPGIGASQSEIDAYLDALASASEAHTHSSDSPLVGEHMAALDLAPRGDATHVAIGDGDWFDPATWANGEVPGDGAKVLIPDGVTVNYAGESDASLFTVRVDGALDFATDVNSQMIFDTFLVSPTGHLIMGTADDPVDPNVDIDLIVANNGPIDTNWDPMLLSRGLISHGDVTIHGAEKDSHEKVTEDPMAGDNSIKFAGTPEGWQVGDTIVIAGTHYDGYKWSNDAGAVVHHESEDEVRVITQIDDDGRIWFDDPLVHDHDAPRDDLSTSVANYTRNVSIETEDFETAEVYERGHVMFMHSDDVDVRYAEFTGLGRTDKSVESFDVGDFSSTNFDSNVQGRYSLHLHRTGVSDPENPTILEGNAVYDSPGWGVVHHDSNAVITNNATFDTFGAGYVAETGNEIGVWSDNIAIYAQGIDWGIPKNTSELEDNFDTARGGDGFWFQGRLVEATDNIAASVNTGFVYFHRQVDVQRMIDFDAALFDYPEALYFDETTSPDDAPILVFDGNETFASKEGLHVVKANTQQGHDIWTHLNDFTAWSVKSGVHLEYTAHYLLTDFDLIGKEDTAFSSVHNGIEFGPNVSEITIINPTISGFDAGIDFHKDFVTSSNSPSLHDYVVIDPNISDVNQTYSNYDPSLDTVTSSGSLAGHDPNLDIDEMTFDGSKLALTGTKYDTLGIQDFPGGIDNFDLLTTDVIRILETKGYWTTDGGQNYTLLDVYFTDRATGEIYYETHPIYITSGVPLGSETSAGGRFADAVDNGIQNITTSGGVTRAGDYVLDTAFNAVPQSASATASDTMSATHAAVSDEIWIDGYDGTHTLDIDVAEGVFVNTGDITNANVTASGGTTVLASDGGEFDLEASRTLAVFEAAAKIGFDGDSDGTAILDMHEGSTLAFAAEDGDLGTIEEINSGAFGDEPAVLSGIDLGNATLSLNLSGLNAEAGTAFTLMNADEIVGIFNEAIVGGLGPRDANIVVDYENDVVTLELSEGNGAITVGTLGAETDVSNGAEGLWEALTADHGVVDETASLGDEFDELIEAA